MCHVDYNLFPIHHLQNKIKYTYNSIYMLSAGDCQLQIYTDNINMPTQTCTCHIISINIYLLIQFSLDIAIQLNTWIINNLTCIINTA